MTCCWLAEALLGDETPELLTNPLNLEQIAALEPDLVTDVMSIGDESQFDTLSAVVPTVGLPPGVVPNGVSWQQVTTTVARAVGRPRAGEQLVAETEEYLDGVASDHLSCASVLSIQFAVDGLVPLLEGTVAAQ